MELTFDSAGREYDPASAKFFMAYIFLRPEGKYRAFAGSLSHGIAGEWDLPRLEKAMGPPDKTQEAGDELEWIYGEQKPIQITFIADALKRALKAVMIIRSDRERPIA